MYLGSKLLKTIIRRQYRSICGTVAHYIVSGACGICRLHKRGKIVTRRFCQTSQSARNVSVACPGLYEISLQDLGPLQI